MEERSKWGKMHLVQICSIAKGRGPEGRAELN